MAILGIYEGHNAGAALISEVDGAVIAAVEEERFSRVKNHDCRPDGTLGPVHSTQWCVTASTEEITTVAIGLEEPGALHRRSINSFLDAVRSGEVQRLDRAAELGMDTAGLLMMPFETQRARIAKATRTAAEAGVDLVRAKTVHVPHHTCHAAAFLLSPVETAVVVTLDGKGDDLSGSVHHGRGHRLHSILEIPTEASLGHLYSAATVACGLRPQRDEGKLTAMAATGRPHARLLTRLRELVSCTDGRLHSSLSRGIVQGPYPDRVPAFHNEAMTAMIEGIERDDVAATVQLVLEETVLALVTHHLNKEGIGVLVASGGVFANVSLNRRVADLPCVDELHVHPGMTDAGVAMGAAAAAYAAVHHRRPMPLHNIALGPAYSEDEAVGTFIGRGYRLSDSNLPAESQIAAALAEGHIAARFVGGCEYGPRALGHRSVLAPASDVRTASELNERLRRSHVMPFAPIVLAEDGPDLFSGLSKVVGPTQYMTTSVLCNDKAQRYLPAAVHQDGTARPQLVDPHRSPDLGALLREFRRLSGRPALINTSFNMHDEPIVCSPEDAARSACQAGLGIVQVGNRVLIGEGCDL
ncbi:carbamoyltransferase C-terminal domain-containing protein [Amycolatopsis sp. lyj-109]|uniref:carbamoyltransferase C-terminal domain-containing protein n=1 Tax=Amycolatopsis sp. lyj-109 TaxID=2789287 RepID=UPI00397D9964